MERARRLAFPLPRCRHGLGTFGRPCATPVDLARRRHRHEWLRRVARQQPPRRHRHRHAALAGRAGGRSGHRARDRLHRRLRGLRQDRRGRRCRSVRPRLRAPLGDGRPSRRAPAARRADRGCGLHRLVLGHAPALRGPARGHPGEPPALPGLGCPVIEGRGEVAVTDSELKQRHRTMWASGDYPLMVETFLLPLGPRLVEACGIDEGTRVLDVASGTGNAAIPAAKRGAIVTASDLTPELLAAGRQVAEAEGLELEWVEADAENLPFPDESFDVVMSTIGVMFAPHHEASSGEMARVCRPGGTIGLLSWTPEGMIGALFRTMGPFAPPPPPGAQPAPLWGSEEHLRGLFGDRVDFHTLSRDNLEITAFERA